MDISAQAVATCEERGIDAVEGTLPDFLLSYEAYHLSTIEAHKAQAKPQHMLPVIAARPNGNGNGWAPPTPMVPRRPKK